MYLDGRSGNNNAEKLKNIIKHIMINYMVILDSDKLHLRVKMSMDQFASITHQLGGSSLAMHSAACTAFP